MQQQTSISHIMKVKLPSLSMESDRFDKHIQYYFNFRSVPHWKWLSDLLYVLAYTMMRYLIQPYFKQTTPSLINQNHAKNMAHLGKVTKVKQLAYQHVKSSQITTLSGTYCVESQSFNCISDIKGASAWDHHVLLCFWVSRTRRIRLSLVIPSCDEMRINKRAPVQTNRA